MFGRKSKFEPEGCYDGHGYKVVGEGKIDVDIDGLVIRFNSFEEMIAGLESADVRDIEARPLTVGPSSISPPPIPLRRSRPPRPPAAPKKKSSPGCGCLMLILFGLIFYFATGNSGGSKVADMINSQFGRICDAKIEGAFSDTLRLDWTSETTKLNVVTVLAAIGKSKELLYSKGIRYLKYPNDSGRYNVIDWKTGEKTSVNESARYYFQN